LALKPGAPPAAAADAGAAAAAASIPEAVPCGDVVCDAELTAWLHLRRCQAFWRHH
jgi:hypothetical protein